MPDGREGKRKPRGRAGLRDPRSDLAFPALGLRRRIDIWPDGAASPSPSVGARFRLLSKHRLTEFEAPFWCVLRSTCTALKDDSNEHGHREVLKRPEGFASSTGQRRQGRFRPCTALERPACAASSKARRCRSTPPRPPLGQDRRQQHPACVSCRSRDGFSSRAPKPPLGALYILEASVCVDAPSTRNTRSTDMSFQGPRLRRSPGLCGQRQEGGFRQFRASLLPTIQPC